MQNNAATNIYALQVKTKGEEKFIRHARAAHPEFAQGLSFPQRCLDIRKGGKTKPSKLAVFPGYVFLELGAEENVKNCFWAFRKIEGFYRFLRSNRDIVPLKNRDLELVVHFIKKVGPLAEKSKVYFDEESKIVVLYGPLAGLEGRIVKVDRRKKRAKISLDLYDDSFFVDLAFEVIEKANERSA
jgi:transcription termination/antitermination protein NusG